MGTLKPAIRRARGVWDGAEGSGARAESAVLEQPDPPVVLKCFQGLSCGIIES